RLARGVVASSFAFAKHLSGEPSGHPILDVAFARAHAHFERLLGDRHIREYADPNAPAALHMARNGAARRLDLACRHAAAIGGLQAELAERHGVAALRTARDLALELFAELGPLRLHHACLPDQVAAGAAGSVDLATAALPTASASASTVSSAGLSDN